MWDLIKIFKIHYQFSKSESDIFAYMQCTIIVQIITETHLKLTITCATIDFKNCTYNEMNQGR